MDRLKSMERWDRRSAPRSADPLVTIQKDGLFSLNQAAFKAIGEPAKVEIFYDRESSIIAFAPTTEKNPVGYPPRKQPTGANWYIAGQKFTKHYGIDTTVARRYLAEVRDHILFINLKGPSTIATGVRAKSASSGDMKTAQQEGN